jgi:homoserine dehydrogenase
MQINIGIIGTGTVGSGTIDIIQQKAASWQQQLGISIQIGMICARTDAELAQYKAQGIAVTTNAHELLSNPNIHIVAELAGGYDLPKQWLTQAFANGKHAVTANKALLAKYGPELFPLAQAQNCHFAFEAAIGGGIPIVRTLQSSMYGNSIQSLSCIINGTCNYILTEMSNTGAAFGDVLREAQDKGYAEADPTFDVDGIDSAHKLALLASICSGYFVDFEKIHISGIRNISIEDILVAQDMHCVIKLLGIFNITEQGVDARVHPCIISKDHQLASVDGVLNAVYLESDNLGAHLQTGAGAGKLPTASAVVADIVNIATQVHQKVGPPKAQYLDRNHSANLIPMSDLRTRYYLRFSTKDQKGILAAITGILSNNNISIESIVQRSVKDPGHVNIGVITERAQEKQILAALAQINALDTVTQDAQMIRFAQ